MWAQRVNGVWGLKACGDAAALRTSVAAVAAVALLAHSPPPATLLYDDLKAVVHNPVSVWL